MKCSTFQGLEKVSVNLFRFEFFMINTQKLVEIFVIQWKNSSKKIIKIGVSVVSQKGLVSTKNLEKEEM